MLGKIALIVVCAAMLFSAIPARADTGPVQRLGTGIPTSIAASPDGKMLAVGSSIGVWFLDAATLRPNGFWDTGVWVDLVEYSADGRYLKVNETVYDTASGTPVSVDAGQVAWVNHRCTFDGRLCAKDFYDKYDPSVLVSTQIINTDTLVSLKILERSTKSAAWSAAGDRLYTVFYDWRNDKYIIKEWDPQSWQETRKLQDFFTNELGHVLWSPDGAEIASSRIVWNTTTAQIVRQRRCNWNDTQATFSCTWPAMGYNYYDVRIYDRASGRVLRTFVPHHLLLRSAALSGDERLLATSGEDQKWDCRYDKDYYARYYDCKTQVSSTRIWGASSFTLLAILPTTFFDIALSFDGRLVIGHTRSGFEAWDWRTSQMLWRAAERTIRQSDISYYGDTFEQCLSVSSSSEFIATYLYDSVYLYHLATGEPVAILTGHTAPITGVAFSPDGTKVAASSLDGTILIWNVP
jgi:WD40 repeat protein